MWCHSYIQMSFIETEKSQSSWTVLKEKKINGDILNTSTLKHAQHHSNSNTSAKQNI